MGFTLEVHNYRALRNVLWSPSGVCAVTGPNGSGKTTLLSVLEFLRHFLERGIQSAAELSGGSVGLIHQNAPQHARSSIELMHGKCFWDVAFITTPPTFEIKESIYGSEEGFDAAQDSLAGTAEIMGRDFPASDQSILARAKSLLPAHEQDWFGHIHLLASNFRLYQHLQFWNLRTVGSPITADLHLHSDGSNAFSLLRNWKAGRREHEERWLFVRNGLRECFPELFEEIEFLAAGQTVTVQFFFKGLREPIPAYSAPHGLLVALLHLCAIASAPDHGAMAIDEPENGLHPFAIQTLLESARERATARDLTILLATHSPVVLNTFNTEPERVYIMEPGHEVLPIALSEHSNKEWLSHFALGDLYSDQSFGAQRRPPT